MNTAYFSVSLETFRLGDSEAVSFFALTRQKQPLKITQFLKNRLRLVWSDQTFPEIIPKLCNPLAQEATNQISFMPYSKAHSCTHLSVHILTCHSLTTQWSYWQKLDYANTGGKKRLAERKEGRNDILVNPTCFWTSKSEVRKNRNRKCKARSLYRALEYPISDFSGGRKIQRGNWYNPKTYKKRERSGQRERDREKQRTEQIQRKECYLLWWI